MINRLGGLEGMQVIIQDFYDRLFDDVMVGFFFLGKDKGRLVEHQLQFTARAFGAQIVYEGKSIAAAHAPFPILPGHFDRRHMILSKTLKDHHVPDDIQKAWLKFDRSFRRAVVKHP